nr:MFS transporter [uncultured Neokomagataea sp.]
MDAAKKPLVGLAGVIVLALATGLNEQVSSQSLSDIMGGLGFSHDPGTWFSSLYTTGEVLGLALSPWLGITFSLRRFIFFVIALATLSSVFIPFITAVPALLMLRSLQGLSGGFAIPLLMTVALRVLAPKIRLVGLAAYASTATLFPYLSGALAALWCDLVGWQFAFFQVVPLSALALVLVWYGMPVDAPRYERFRQIDWRGMLLAMIGFSSLTTMLQQGDRLDWFNSQLICVLALISAVSIPLFVVNEWFHELPLFKFQLLSRRNFAYGAITLPVFVLTTIASTAIPGGALAGLAGYRPEQSYGITLEIALIQLIMLPFLAWLLNREWVDCRVVSLTGLLCLLVGCLGGSFVTTVWDRGEFYLWQAFFGVGGSMVVMCMLLMATNSLSPQEGPFAAAMVNCPRGMASTVGVWLVQLVQRWRGGLHSDRLTDHLGQERFRLWQGENPALQYPTPLLPNGIPRSPVSVRYQAYELAHQTRALVLSDVYLVVAGLVIFLIFLVLLVPERTYPPRIALAKK